MHVFILLIHREYLWSTKSKNDHSTLNAQEGVQLTPPFTIELTTGYTLL